MNSNLSIASRSFVFGPVPSRRLGRSLGIDLLPCKMCSFDCIYCECGPTEHLTVKRFSEPSPNEVLSSLKAFVEAFQLVFDVITFSGSGEPTLYEPIGDLIDLIKRDFPSRPVAVLTNGSLFMDPSVRASLLRADIVSPSLDAPDEALFRKINRPHPSLTWEGLVEGLIAFRKEYRGIYRLEVLLIKNINDSHEHLERIANVASRINPDVVDLTTIARPGTVSSLQGLSREEVEKCAEFFKDVPCSIVGGYLKKDVAQERKISPQMLETQIVNLLARRPCSLDDLADSLGVPSRDASQILSRLTAERKVLAQEVNGKIFYSLASSLP